MFLYLWSVSDYDDSAVAVAVARTEREARVLAAISVQADNDLTSRSVGEDLLYAVRSLEPSIVKPVNGPCAIAY
jgi:hypothetical protein